MPASSTIKLNPTLQHNSSNLSDAMNRDICELNRMSLQGLVPMFVAEKQIFDYRLVRTPQGMVSEGLSPRYTIMTLLGLRELERTGARTPFECRRDLRRAASRHQLDRGRGRSRPAGLARRGFRA